MTKGYYSFGPDPGHQKPLKNPAFVPNRSFSPCNDCMTSHEPKVCPKTAAKPGCLIPCEGDGEVPELPGIIYTNTVTGEIFITDCNCKPYQIGKDTVTTVVSIEVDGAGVPLPDPVIAPSTTIASPGIGDTLFEHYTNGFIWWTFDGTAWNQVVCPILTAEDIKAIALQCIIDNATTLVDEGNGVWVWTNPATSATTTIYDTDTYVTIVENSNGTLTITDVDGNQFTTMLDTDTWTTFVDNGDGTITFTDPDGNVVTTPTPPTPRTDAEIKAIALACIQNNQIITTLTDNGNNTFTYVNEDGVPVTINLAPYLVDTDTTYTSTVNGSVITIDDSNGMTILNVDVCALMLVNCPPNETVTTITLNPDGSFTYLNENGTPVVYNSPATDITVVGGDTVYRNEAGVQFCIFPAVTGSCPDTTDTDKYDKVEGGPDGKGYVANDAFITDQLFIGGGTVQIPEAAEGIANAVLVGGTGTVTVTNNTTKDMNLVVDFEIKHGEINTLGDNKVTHTVDWTVTDANGASTGDLHHIAGLNGNNDDGMGIRFDTGKNNKELSLVEACGGTGVYTAQAKANWFSGTYVATPFVNFIQTEITVWGGTA